MILVGGKSEIQGEADSLKLSFSSLIDAMRFSQRMGQLKEEIASLERERERKIAALGRLVEDISSRIENSRENLGKDYALELSKTIPPFAGAATDQVRKKVNDYYNRALKETRSLIESENTRTFKSIESFLSTSPIPFLETVIHLKFSEGAYSAKCNYRCVNDIRYEFSLETKKNAIFGKEFRLGSLGFGIKMPVSLGKSWLKKGPTPEYERLDQYVLTECEASEGHLIADFAHPERESQVRIVYSKQEGSSTPLLEINYKDEGRNVEIAREPGLHRFLDTEAIIRPMDQIWTSVIALEKGKLGLTALSCNGADVLEQLDCTDFFDMALKTISPALIKTFKNVPPSRKVPPIDEFNEAYVRQKVALLGDGGPTVLLMLGL